MMKEIYSEIRLFLTEPRWEKVRGVLWFCLITVGIHFTWRLWSDYLNYAPIKGFMTKASVFFVNNLFNHSVFVIHKVMKIPVTTYGNIIVPGNSTGLSLNDSCSGVKQIMQFAILMLIYPGPWKHKAWFIPLGMVVVHLTNILRISLLAVVSINWPQQITYAHDNWLRVMFYVVIFLMWLLWVEKIAVRKSPQEIPEQ